MATDITTMEEKKDIGSISKLRCPRIMIQIKFEKVKIAKKRLLN
jgi:hypothetical protein